MSGIQSSHCNGFVGFQTCSKCLSSPLFPLLEGERILKPGLEDSGYIFQVLQLSEERYCNPFEHREQLAVVFKTLKDRQFRQEEEWGDCKIVTCFQNALQNLHNVQRSFNIPF